MKCPTLSAILENRYGVGALVACPTTVLWAWAVLANDKGEAVADKELSALNRKRNGVGKMPAHKPYGYTAAL